VYEPDGNLVQLINDRLSERIKQFPEQWTWGHRRSERDLYARRR
jgi:lauroyl/myristoyl acyltransferase